MYKEGYFESVLFLSMNGFESVLFVKMNDFDVSNCCILEKECNLILWKLQMLRPPSKS